jgi:hypothetical protein
MEPKDLKLASRERSLGSLATCQIAEFLQKLMPVNNIFVT